MSIEGLVLWQFRAREFRDRGKEIGHVTKRARDDATLHAWSAGNERHARAEFARLSFAIASGAIITDENDDGVFIETTGFERSHEPAHEMVEIFQVGLQARGPVLTGVFGVGRLDARLMREHACVINEERVVAMGA